LEQTILLFYCKCSKNEVKRSQLEKKMAVTRINNNQVTDAAAGNTLVGINAGTKLQPYSITATKIANNLTYGSDLTITGNLTVQGTTTNVDTVNTLIKDPLITLADGQTSGTPTLDIGTIGLRGSQQSAVLAWQESSKEFVTALSSTTVSNTTFTLSAYANLHSGNTIVQGTTSLVGNIIGAVNATATITGGNLATPGTASAGGNITGANILTGGLVSATGSLTGGNIFTAGNVSATGNVTGGNIIAGNAVVGNISLSGDINVANINATGYTSVTGNVTGGNIRTAGQVSAAGTATLGAVNTGGAVSATGNVTGGNVLTGGLISATATITGGNLATGGTASATGNITGGNVLTGGQVSATGNITAGNIINNGLTTTTGNITGGNLLTGGLISATGSSTAGSYNTGGTVSATGTITGGNLATGGTASATGTITGGNLATGGTASATGNITSGAGFLGVFASVSGNVTGGNVRTNTIDSTSLANTTLTINAATISLNPTGNVGMNSRYINNLADPVADQDAATKFYVDSVAQGLDPKASVVLATTANIAPYTYNNGTAGVGATITLTSTGNLTLDGSVVTVNSRVLIKNEVGAFVNNTTQSAAFNGIYVVTTAGAPGVAAVLTRAADMNVWAEVPNAFTFVETGATLADTGWVCTANQTGTMGTTQITWTQFSGAGSYTAGNALSLTGTQFNVQYDTSASGTIGINGSNQLYIPAGAVLTTPNIGAATGTSVSVTGTVTAATHNGTTFSASGNITAGNIINNGITTVTGNITGGNILTGGLISATSTITGGNLATGGTASAGGNITGANLLTGGLISATATITGGNIATGGTVSATGNGTFGNISTAGSFSVASISATGNITGGNLLTSGVTSAGGNVTGANILTGGLISATATITGGNLATGGTASATGTITGGNIATGGTASATGNITGGNILTGGLISAASTITSGANITGANILTGGIVSATANITGGNVLTGGLVSATGSGTFANIVITGNSVNMLNPGGTIQVNGAGANTNFSVSGTGANVFFVNATTNSVSFGSSAQTTNAIAAFNTTTSILIPAGTQTQRPGTGVTGMMRFNSTTNSLEIYNNTAWIGVGSTVFTVITDQQFSGDNSTTAFTLANSSTTAATIVSINGVLQIPVSAYAVSGTTLTFTEAPATGDLIDVRALTTTTTLLSLQNVSGNGAVTLSDTTNIVTITGTANVVGDLNVTGNATILGNVATNQIINGISGVIIPSPGGNVVIDVGNTNDIATFTTNSMEIHGNIVPQSNVTYTLGTSALRWKDLYLSGNSIYLGNATISANATALIMTNPAGGQTVLAGATTTSSVAGNITGGNIITGGIVSAFGNIITGTDVSTPGRIGVGTSTPDCEITILANPQTSTYTLTGSSTTLGTDLHIVGADSSQTRIVQDTFGTGAYVAFTGRAARGTAASPTATQSSDIIAEFTGRGFSSGSLQFGNASTGKLDVVAAEAFTDTSRATNIVIYTTASGAITPTAIATFSSAAGLSVAGNVTLGNLVNSGANGVGNIGSSTTYFNTVFAKATSAQYADLAEKYTADAEYAPGTVVVFGGPAEVTVDAVDADRKVAGVVSTNPSYTMNSGLEGEHVATIALTGRVPCMVVGPVRKGDLMVAAGLGRARAEADPRVGAVIGKALEDFDGAEGTIEVVVGRF
jgi:hypothetical protein